MLRELPPTSGLAPRFGDLFRAVRTDSDLASDIARLLRTPQVQIECSGTACLVVALEYLKTRSRKRTVIVPAYTCPLVPLAAAHTGLRVVACDTAAGGLELDLDHLRRLVDRDTLCVVPTHYGGALTDIGRVRRLVESLSPEIVVVEDAAQAFGARWHDASVGFAGHIGFYSFAAGKGFTLFEGGCLVSDDASMRAGLRAMGSAVIKPSLALEARRISELIGYHALYGPFGLRLSYGMARRRRLRRGDDIRAVGDYFESSIPLHPVGAWRRRVGSQSLTRLEGHLELTRRRFRRIQERIGKITPEIAVHAQQPGTYPTGTFVFVTLPTRRHCDQVLAELWPSGLGVTRLFARAIGDYPYLAGALAASSTPNARELAARTLTVTTSELLEDEELETICAVIEKACRPS